MTKAQKQDVNDDGLCHSGVSIIGSKWLLLNGE